MRQALPEYPWDAMEPYAARASRHPEGVLNLSVGSPVDPSPSAVREALAAATDAHAYPATAGAPALREAIAEWYGRRRGVSVAADAVLPTVGSKELVALLPFLLGIGAEEAVVHPTIAYPSYTMGAALVGADAVAADDPATWPEHTRLVWVNSPSNPDGRVLDAEALRAAVERARELGAVIAGDECYAEFGWEAPWDEQRIPSILDPRVVGDDHRGVLSVYSLSKQSNLAGYRAAFLAGDPALVSRLLTVRKHAGLMLPAPVQAAMQVALADEQHVDEQRARYRARRDVLRPALEGAGFTIEGSEAGLYLWATRDADAWESVAQFADLGIIVGPGHFYGDRSPRHVRLALTAPDADIAAAAARIAAAAGAPD
ncbi:succinyldiaminopimelate transaminase [Leucobacter chromiiresistens]|uniref:Aminotransferase n=1 Tax=Leucobacter chromiiresistens TaxID=1079994 RepID=A0A1H1AF12_9MICO|nr:succinyldiaminopimelate transaminase [Leucobacter chromiiresistens]SDQ38259.1 succinyldiaminopimelate transaminase [Leucobacter chromiiresistens]